jgi:uncharacterized tellurite resistance protein B-like protein
MVLEAVLSFFQSRLVPAGEQHQPDRVAIAVCALLLEVAHADGLGPEESERIQRAAREELLVPEEDVREVLRLAEDQRRESVDLYQFTRLVAEHFTLAQRRRLVETIWEVVYADGTLSMVENHLARRVAELLGFQHPEVQEIKEQVAARSS